MPNLSRLLGVVLVATVVASIGLPIFGIGSFHAADMMGTLSPWNETVAYDFQPDNTHVSDTVNAVVPMRAAFRDRVLEGDLPMWDSLRGMGAPLAVIPNASVFSPLTVPYLVAPLWLAPVLTKLLELGVAVLGMFLLVRRWGLGRPAALVGALAFVNSAFLVVWTNWPQSAVGALVPLLLWAVERGVTAPRHRQVWPVAAIGAVMWLEGFPAVTVYALATAGAYAVVRVVVVHGRGRQALARLSALAGAVALSLGVAALQLMPFLHHLRSLGLQRGGVAGTPLPWHYLTTLAVPDALGNPLERAYYGPSNYVEGTSWVGVVALVLVAVLVANRRRLELPRGVFAFLVGASATGLVLVYFDSPLLDLVGRIPLVGTNFIGRYRAVLGVLVAGGAAAGYQAFVEAEGPLDRRRTVLALVALAVAMVPLGVVTAGQAAEAGRLVYAVMQAALPLLVAALALSVVVGHVRRRPPGPVGMAAVAAGVGGLLVASAAYAVQAGVGGDQVRRAVQTTMFGLVVGTVAVALLVAAAAWLRSRGALLRIAVVALPVLLAAEAVAFAHPWWGRTAPGEFYPTTETHEYLAANLGSDRVASANSTLYPGTNLVYGLRSVTAHVQVPQTVRAYMQALQPDAFARSSSFPFLSAELATATSPLLDRAGARYWAVNPHEPLYGRSRPGIGGDEPLPLADGDEAVAPLDPGRIRGLTLTYLGGDGLSGHPAVAAEVRTAQGEVVATGSTRLHAWVRPGELPVALGEVEVPAGAELVVRLEGASTGTIRLASDGTRPAHVVTEREDDGLRLVHAAGAVVYAREDALPRIRWAGRAARAGSAAEQLAVLADDPPDDVVVLGGDGPRDDDPSAGVVDVREDSGDAVVVTVDADGDGFVVVADAIQFGWHVELDGAEVPLLAADHAFGAVAVPAGEHEVRFWYDPPGWGTGQLVTALSVAALLALAGAELLGVRRSRRRSATSEHPQVVADGRRRNG